MGRETLLLILVAAYVDVAVGGGVRQVAASCSTDKLDIAFIVDSSGSIRSKNYELVKNFVIEFIGVASIDDGTVRIGVITFATSVSVIAYLNSQTNATSLQEVVKNITYDRGYTNTAAGLWAANYKVFQRSNGDRSEVPNVAILIADGVSNVNVKETVPQANLLKATGAKIIALGVTTSNMTKDELDKLASLPLRDHRIDVDSFTQLAGLSNSILSVTCAETITPPPTTTPVFVPTTTTTTSTPTTTTTTTTTTTATPTTTATATSTTTTTTTTTTTKNTAITPTTITTSASTTTTTTPPTTTTTIPIRKSPGKEEISSGRGDPVTGFDITVSTPDVAPRITENIQTSTMTSATTTTASTTSPTTTTSTTTTTTPDTTPRTKSTTTLTTISPVSADSRPIPITAGVTTAIPESTVCQDNPLDIAFIVDASSSVGNDQFRLVVDYIKSVLSTTDIDGGKVHAAVLTYSTDVAVHINLNDFKTRKEFYGALDGIPYIPGWTNAAEALRTVRTQVFTPKTGDRVEVNNVALLITDGQSNINKNRTILEARNLKMAGIHVLAVGVGLASLGEVDSIVTSPANENRFTVAGYNNLRGLGEVLFPFLCQDGVTGIQGNRDTTPEALKSSETTTQAVSTLGGTHGGRYSGTGAQDITMPTTFPAVMKTRQLQCHAWCEDNQEEKPAVNTDDLVLELILPKRTLSKQRRAKGSASDDSPVAKSIGTSIFLLFLTPYFFFVGWDILDVMRYLFRSNKGSRSKA